MNPLKQLAGQTAIYGLSSVIARILNFLLVPFYTRVFTDPAEYGVVNELYAYVAFLIVILTYGMETAFFRFSSKHNDSDVVFSTALISLLTTSGLFILVILFFYPGLAGIIGYEQNKSFILLLGMVLAVDAMAAIPFARLRYRNKALKFALIKLFNITVNIFFNFLFLFLIPWMEKKGYGIYLLEHLYNEDFRVGYVFVSNLLASIFTLGWFVKDIAGSRLRFSCRLLRSMLLYSFPLLIAGLAGTVNEVIDRIMLRYRLPAEVDALEQIGIYGANVKIAVLMTLFIQMFRYASEPFFFSQEKNKSSPQLYARVLNYFTIAGTLVFLIISLYLDIFKHIIGTDYHEGIGVVPIILLGNLMLGIYFNLSVWYKLRELTIFGAIFAVSGAVVTVGVNYFFIPVYGYMASAWGHLLSYSIMVLISFFIGKYYYPIPYNVKRVLFYLFLSVGLYLISAAVKIDDIIYRLTLNTLLFVIFALVVFIREKNLRNEIITIKRQKMN